MTPREEEILSVVTNCVRAITVDQVARTWWTPTAWGRSRAKSMIQSLSREGWLQMQQALARPVSELVAPLVTWYPHENEPDFLTLSRFLHRRAKAAAQLAEIAFATSKSTALFGRGSVPKIKLTQMTHDLHVTEIFLNYRRHGLTSDRWVGEDNFPFTWPVQQRPDAALQNVSGSIYRAVEYGGDYSLERLQELHSAFSSPPNQLAYEIW